MSSEIGVIVIGRNEGERLVKCFKSLLTVTSAIVYVDSGSTDHSVKLAASMGVVVVDLDLSQPFTAARARNAGFDKIIKIYPDILFVQFVDGDCEIISGWMEKAIQYLKQHDKVAIVCGRRMERFPEHSVYNYQCDLEWNTPIGEAKASGGDFMCRSEVFANACGFNPGLIAGEEPELCFRLRKNGWKVMRIAADMTLHDAAILKFSQWWKRSQRAGHAFAEGAFLHGRSDERHYVRETKRAIIWGGMLPLIAIILMISNSLIWLSILAIYILQWIRIYTKLGHTKFRVQLTCLMILCKFPEFTGVFMFWKNKLIKNHAEIIEYK